jgi:HKD family nuclease
MLVRYVDSASRAFDQTLLSWLMNELPTATEFLAASGYFEATVLDWIEPDLLALLGRGGTAFITVGSNQGLTSADDLDRLFRIVEPHRAMGSGLAVVHIPGGLFHPKTYFAARPGRATAFVGSPNLTAASGVVNVEAAVILESETLEPPLDVIRDALTRTTVCALANAFEICSVPDIRELQAMGAVGVPRPPAVTRSARGGATAAALRRLARFPAATRVGGIPPPTARRPGLRHVAPAAPVIVPPAVPAHTTVAFVFAPNDLKVTGTREFSVPAGVRGWAASVLGAPVVAGQGDLMHFNLLARLAAAPNTVAASPELVRLWSAGASGGTHQDVRMVIGSAVRQELEDTSMLVHGAGLEGQDVGVLELPADPTREPVRLTIYRPRDPEFAVLDGMCVRGPGTQKRQAIVTGTPAITPWPY